MKRKNVNVWRGLAIIIGVGIDAHCAMAAPTVADCKTVYSDVNCSEYQLSTSAMSNGGTLYICTCVNCEKDYALDGGGGGYRNAGVYSFWGPNKCGYHPSSGDTGAESSACTSAGGTACTTCQGLAYTINGVRYCGAYSDGMHLCNAGGGANAAYTMSSCCKDNKAYLTDGCFVVSCKNGMVAAPDRHMCVCNVGYYGDANGCTQCPALGGVNGLTSGTGAAVITDCFIPAGVPMKDTTGTYEFTSDCQYE